MAATTKPKKKKASVDDILAKATAPERSVRICVAGQLSGEYEQTVAELEQVANDSVTDQRLSGGGNPRRFELARRVRELEQEMEDATFTFTFRAVPAKQWSDLLAEHPDPKKERLFNPDTFVPASIAACCIEPEELAGDPEKAATLFDALSSGQQGDLFEAAWEVNQSGPKGQTSWLASAVLRASEMSSGSAETTGSPDPTSSD